MPRRKKVELSIAERIAAVEAELETLAAQTSMKKQELKDLKEKQAETDKAKLIEAFIASGKSIDEVVGMLKPELNTEWRSTHSAFRTVRSFEGGCAILRCCT